MECREKTEYLKMEAGEEEIELRGVTMTRVREFK